MDDDYNPPRSRQYITGIDNLRKGHNRFRTNNSETLPARKSLRIKAAIAAARVQREDVMEDSPPPPPDSPPPMVEETHFPGNDETQTQNNVESVLVDVDGDLEVDWNEEEVDTQVVVHDYEVYQDGVFHVNLMCRLIEKRELKMRNANIPPPGNAWSKNVRWIMALHRAVDWLEKACVLSVPRLMKTPFPCPWFCLEMVLLYMTIVYTTFELLWMDTVTIPL